MALIVLFSTAHVRVARTSPKHMLRKGLIDVCTPSIERFRSGNALGILPEDQDGDTHWCSLCRPAPPPAASPDCSPSVEALVARLNDRLGGDWSFDVQRHHRNGSGIEATVDLKSNGTRVQQRPPVGYVDPCARSRTAAFPERFFTYDTVTGEILPKEDLSPGRYRKHDGQSTTSDSTSGIICGRGWCGFGSSPRSFPTTPPR